MILTWRQNLEILIKTKMIKSYSKIWSNGHWRRTCWLSWPIRKKTRRLQTMKKKLQVINNYIKFQNKHFNFRNKYLELIQSLGEIACMQKKSSIISLIFLFCACSKGQFFFHSRFQLSQWDLKTFLETNQITKSSPTLN